MAKKKVVSQECDVCSGKTPLNKVDVTFKPKVCETHTKQNITAHIKEFGDKYVVYRFFLSGNETKDEAYVEGVRNLSERNRGEFYLVNDSGKGLYSFEIGGIFYHADDVLKFKAGMEKIQP